MIKTDYAQPIGKRRKCRRFHLPEWLWCGNKKKFPRRFNEKLPLDYQGERT